MLLNDVLSHSVMDEIDSLLEGVTDMPEGADLTTQLEILMNRLETIKKALGITNRLPVGESRRYHRSRIMGFMNKVRAMFNKVASQIEAEMKGDATDREDGPAVAALPQQSPAPARASFADQFRQAA